MHEAETKFIHECRREQVSLGDVEKARVHRSIEREVQGGRTDTAGQCAAQGFLKIATAEGQEGLSESEKKKRTENLSWPPRNSRSQLVVN